MTYKKVIYRTIGSYTYNYWYENGDWYVQRWDWKKPVKTTYEGLSTYFNAKMDEFLEQERKRSEHR